MRREHFFFESALVNHDLEVYIHILPTGQVVSLLLFLLTLHILHLHPPFLSFLLDHLKVLQRVALLLLLTLHAMIIIQIASKGRI